MTWSAKILRTLPIRSRDWPPTSVPGVATGMAYTPVGGEILFIEATRMPRQRRIILTGQIGEVMI